ncbi:hypothetical protein [Candidatus Berkiella aquae]|uniref:Uncharacterized protein n=1 Tax=Candidatus Berkiella aquae TaxID=295108 RepID=A0A0Q9YR14_9GAMM|nr:hypothetical protein [Candidatus Berkiella aquae]MCS5712454.1 hypothetical protein [Candidatus Berkiella aquae]
MDAKSKNVLIVELNEFNTDIIQSAVNQYSLPALAKIWRFPKVHYKSPDRYNSGYLEPWVQWVSIHSATPSSEHRIKHLGDVPDLTFKQCWEVLSDYGISMGVWGVMNGACQSAKQVPFFLPDPWTFTEAAKPTALNNLLELPRYVAKNYQHLSKMTLLKKAWKLFAFIATSRQGSAIFKEVFALIKSLIKHGKHHYVFISFFDYISTLLFSEYKKKYNPRVSILFLNSLAHIQHHHWHDGPEKVTPEILHGLQQIDRLFAHLLKTFPHDAIVVHNGLSQMNTNHEKPWVLYRQKDPAAFLKALGLPIVRVEQHMTHDGHVFFTNAKDCDDAFTALRNATIAEKSLFHVEKNAHDDCKLFYQLKFTDMLPDKNITFTFQEKEYAFFSYFDEIVTRTGRHIPMGTIFSDTLVFPDQLYNHEFNQYLYHYLLPTEYPLPMVDKVMPREEVV